MSYDYRNAIETIDADLFSSDIYDDKTAADSLRSHLERWTRKLNEVQQVEPANTPRRNLTRAETIMLRVYRAGGNLVRAKTSYEQAMRKAGLSINDPAPPPASVPDFVNIAAERYVNAMNEQTEAATDLGSYLQGASLIF